MRKFCILRAFLRNTILKKKFFSIKHVFERNFFSTTHDFESKSFFKNHDFEIKVFRPVRFRIKIFIMCLILNQLFYNALDFEQFF